MLKTESISMAERETHPAPGREPSPDFADEACLVETARRDGQALAALYRRWVGPVYRYLHQWVGNAADAEDLTSQVFIEMLERLASYQERGNFAAWLFTIARRKAIAQYRRQQHHLLLDEDRNRDVREEDPLEGVERRAALERVAGLIAKLEDEQQELLRLRFAASLTYGEIAILLGRSEASVKMAIHRLLHKLHTEWEKKE